MKRIESIENVNKFLNSMKEIVNESECNLKIIKENKLGDKTHEFMVEHNLRRKNVCAEIMKLDVSNYSYTDDDYDSRFHGDVWFFGQMFFIDKAKYYEIYIKLKKDERIICMSFHPKEFDLNYPYNS